MQLSRCAGGADQLRASLEGQERASQVEKNLRAGATRIGGRRHWIRRRRILLRYGTHRNRRQSAGTWRNGRDRVWAGRGYTALGRNTFEWKRVIQFVCKRQISCGLLWPSIRTLIARASVTCWRGAQKSRLRMECGMTGV